MLHRGRSCRRPSVSSASGNAGRSRWQSYQPLAAGANYTAAGWNSGDGKVYVAKGAVLRSYDYVTNTAGTGFKIPLLTGITGMDFSSDGADLYVSTNAETVRRVDWASKTLVSGWTFDLTPFDVRDSRAVELINGQFYVAMATTVDRVGDPCGTPSSSSTCFRSQDYSVSWSPYRRGRFTPVTEGRTTRK